MNEAEKVQWLLDNPQFSGAVDRLREKYQQRIIDAPINGSPENLELIMDLKRQLIALESMMNELRQEIVNQKVIDNRAEAPSYLGELNGKTN